MDRRGAEEPYVAVHKQAAAERVLAAVVPRCAEDGDDAAGLADGHALLGRLVGANDVGELVLAEEVRDGLGAKADGSWTSLALSEPIVVQRRLLVGLGGVRPQEVVGHLLDLEMDAGNGPYLHSLDGRGGTDRHGTGKAVDVLLCDGLGGGEGTGNASMNAEDDVIHDGSERKAVEHLVGGVPDLRRQRGEQHIPAFQ